VVSGNENGDERSGGLVSGFFGPHHATDAGVAKSQSECARPEPVPTSRKLSISGPSEKAKSATVEKKP